MKTNDFSIPEEIRSNRVDDLFKPCWIVKAQRSDGVESPNEEGWVALVVFEDTREMLEMIGDWGQPVPSKQTEDYGVTGSAGPGV